MSTIDKCPECSAEIQEAVWGIIMGGYQDFYIKRDENKYTIHVNSIDCPSCGTDLDIAVELEIKSFLCGLA